jgi:hydrogenase maturation protease
MGTPGLSVSAGPPNLTPRTVVIGVGNALRCDDAAGLHVARRLRTDPRAADIEVREMEGEALGLLDVWEGADAVVIVDAVRSGASPGMIHRIRADVESLPATLRGSTSTHAFGLREAIELARALGRLPARVVIYGVEGRDFLAGTDISPEVEAAIDGLAERLWREVLCPTGRFITEDR